MPDSESNLVAAERIAILLARREISAVVIGAIALAAYRYVRHTEDIDLGVDATVPQLRLLLSDLRAEGFDAILHEPDAGGSRSKADIVELLRRNPESDLAMIRETCARYRIPGFDSVLEELG